MFWMTGCGILDNNHGEEPLSKVSMNQVRFDLDKRPAGLEMDSLVGVLSSNTDQLNEKVSLRSPMERTLLLDPSTKGKQGKLEFQLYSNGLLVATGEAHVEIDQQTNVTLTPDWDIIMMEKAILYSLIPPQMRGK